MAVLVEFEVPGATPEQMYDVEARTQERGEALGRPPYAGCLFLAVTAEPDGFRFVSVWRTEAGFREVLEGMIEPDLAAVGCRATGIEVTPVFGMAIPGTGAP